MAFQIGLNRYEYEKANILKKKWVENIMKKRCKKTIKKLAEQMRKEVENAV